MANNYYRERRILTYPHQTRAIDPEERKQTFYHSLPLERTKGYRPIWSYPQTWENQMPLGFKSLPPVIEALKRVRIRYGKNGNGDYEPLEMLEERRKECPEDYGIDVNFYVSHKAFVPAEPPYNFYGLSVVQAGGTLINQGVTQNILDHDCFYIDAICKHTLAKMRLYGWRTEGGLNINISFDSQRGIETIIEDGNGVGASTTLCQLIDDARRDYCSNRPGSCFDYIA